MKKDIHPTYHSKVNVRCACGATFDIGSTKDKMEIEVCSQCHQFYTGDSGSKKSIDRVEKFKARQGAAKGDVKSKHEKKAEKRARLAEEQPRQAASQEAGPAIG